jgi:hypothetical protein
MISWTERAKAAISQKGLIGTAKTDETTVSRLLAVSSVPARGISVMPIRLSSVLTVTSPATFERNDASIGGIECPDRWCWPHSTAMTSREIYILKARLFRFTEMGLTLALAEFLADKLATRDRESDDRRLCIECSNAGPGWRCNLRAGFLMDRLHRCDYFKDSTQ